jgi:hypothetical protein
MRALRCLQEWGHRYFLEATMAAKKKASGKIKNKRAYKALKKKGMSKTRAAKIANSGKTGARKGGRNSRKKKS